MGARSSKFSSGKKTTDYTRPNQRTPQFWSFSRLGTWESGCKLRFALQYIWKLQQPDNRAMERGSDIHAKAEGYLKGTVRGIPKELMQFREEFAAVRKMGALAEESYTVTKTWQPTHATDWDHAWLRAKVDIEIPVDEDGILTIVDVKTGRPYDNHDDQAGIYGTLGFIIHPEAQQVDFEYWYVDSGEVGHHEFQRTGLRERKAAWKKRAAPMLKATTFPASPGDACARCPFRSDKKLRGGEAGPCDAWKKA